MSKIISEIVLKKNFSISGVTIKRGTVLKEKYEFGIRQFYLPIDKEKIEQISMKSIKENSDLFSIKKVKPKSIVSLIQYKPSIALELMVKGLEKYPKRSNFRIDMNTFGDSIKVKNDLICYGCAATCTIQEIAEKQFINGEIVLNSSRAQYLGFDKYELDIFEDAIDCARQGSIQDLFTFCEIDTNDISTSLLEPSFYLGTTNYKKMLPKVKVFIKKLKKAGY